MERAHLFDVARAAHPLAPPSRAAEQGAHPPLGAAVLDAMTGAAAHLGNERLDILANPLGRALFPEMFDGHERPNAARFVFFDPRARDFCLDWDRIARDVVALLRSAAGRNPYDRDVTDLIGELSTRSDEFRQHWARHDVRFHLSGVKRYHHRDVGDLELNYQRLNLAFDTGLTIIIHTADPGTRSAEALALLGTLAATAAAENATSALTQVRQPRTKMPTFDAQDRIGTIAVAKFQSGGGLPGLERHVVAERLEPSDEAFW